MRFKQLLLPLFLLIVTQAEAQYSDSVAVRKARWQKVRIAKDVRLYRYHFNAKELFSANEFISYLEVKRPGKRAMLEIGYEKQELKTVPAFGEQAGALAAVNGTFFDVKNGGSVDFIKSAGQVITQNRLDKDGKRSRHQMAAVVIHNGKPEIVKWDGSADWENKLPHDDVMLSGPLLRLNGLDESLDSAAFNKLRHPRTCVGLRPDGKIILLTVDGRQEQSAGMSLFELTKLMRWLGCIAAINLDGGGSTTLWVNAEPDGGVVNYPSDNKKWDHAGTRKVANVIFVKAKKR
ncbi:phosphodiester glycosidase family protein [Pedobacter sp. SYP-B3415]|uniref:phosphodiester glycosidase family protein n=1 Tax=Pedobacter sp. SYP-B3415 TaxID=2496641 RepID=UPI00101BDD66|nr:phosphodiester glycosidase family protein [Pedobacter sp. SYP-B3415]